MGGVADERQPLADEAARDLEAERKGFDRRGERELAELRREAQFELAQKIFRLERDERPSVGAALVPDDARPASGQRQDGERAGRQEMLLGDAFVVALMRDRRDDAGLVVVPAVGRNGGERRAASSARRRPRPRGGRGTRGRRRAKAPATCLPGLQRATEPATRSTPSRTQSAESAATTSSLNAMWASGPSPLASK